MDKNYSLIKKEIEEATISSGRDPKTVKLMLVSKTVPVEVIKEAIKLGHQLYGENKVQELSEKVPALRELGVEFHFIGHLQSNKVKKCIENATMIHSVDRLSLAEELNRQLQKLNKEMDILIQVNTSREESKFGVAPEKVYELIESVAKLPYLKIKGLMTLAKFSSEEHEVRPCFQLLKKIADDIKEKNIPGVSMDELSMGMSSDFKMAIEEGATIIRVGTAVFGKRETPDSYYWPENKKLR